MKRKTETNGLLRPLSMEPKGAFLERFARSPNMIDLFPDTNQRRTMGETVFRERWEDALVRVVKEDGTQFFID